MKRSRLLIGMLVLIGLIAITVFAIGPATISEVLVGYEEVPAISTGASAVFKARISEGVLGFPTQQIDYELSYTALEGAVQQSHIHFGQKSVNGAIVVFLCTNLGNGPAGTQPCPQGPATIRGTITPADITNLANAQGISAGEWNEFINAMRAGVTYVNIHSTRWPGGEIRSQIDVNENGSVAGVHH